ncbi:MAG: histidine--tRNA ligase [Candidatus Yanofskybacteria bacterium CG10_big_fil_rev_8_21_14_0_10_46_23]|uniref:Histidine--tRNA ligase n=1 Tax=Candidatus Yanofskybacteria bacterium CG10_big_fil_rev_8_21_14_0_10_46_23 TaxID=1975098 RepID=A0A2H0R3L4_9BACT|nr:MAG: histidine--tRNA ligase [Candidatus Yanofskybacteria bacterium CG10_big_fil_rev_8_21_14_0_10_46_23]
MIKKNTAEEEEEIQRTRKRKPKIQSVKGMADILPEEQIFWRHLRRKGLKVLEDYGYRQVETPVLEYTKLFTDSIGAGTDVIDKELYSLKTKGGDELSLRPEGTAPVVRAYVENGMNVWPSPIQLYYDMPMFRHDQPQQGRTRQFNQIGVELFGVAGPIGDAQVILIAFKFLQAIGLRKILVKINSIGSGESRKEYIKKLKDFIRPKLRKLPAEDRLRYKTNILRMFDSKNEKTQEIMAEAPQILDHLDKASKDHFKKVIEFLDDLEIPYVLDPTLVRGLDYYTKTVFEIVPEEKPSKKSDGKEEETKSEDKKRAPLTLIAGGRYDRLVDKMGGPKTPGVGWAAGVERIILTLKENKISVSEGRATPQIFVAQLGDAGQRKGMCLFERLIQANVNTVTSLGRESIKSQLRVADKVGAPYALIVGQKEALDETVILRDMESGIQEVLPIDKIIDIVQKRLKNK